MYAIRSYYVDNVVRHANAKAAWVRLQITPEHLLLTVQDDGQGIAPDAEPGGIGIITMRERVASWA